MFKNTYEDQVINIIKVCIKIRKIILRVIIKKDKIIRDSINNDDDKKVTHNDNNNDYKNNKVI